MELVFANASLELQGIRTSIATQVIIAPVISKPSRLDIFFLQGAPMTGTVPLVNCVWRENAFLLAKKRISAEKTPTVTVVPRATFLSARALNTITETLWTDRAYGTIARKNLIALVKRATNATPRWRNACRTLQNPWPMTDAR